MVKVNCLSLFNTLTRIQNFFEAHIKKPHLKDAAFPKLAVKRSSTSITIMFEGCFAVRPNQT